MRPKKKFGQHFLTSVGHVKRIIALAGVSKGDQVLEIGPGKGALTRQLVEVGARVTAVDFDEDMVGHITTHFPEVNVIFGDAAKMDWSQTLSGGGWKCVSNLPYNVGTSIVTGLLCYPSVFDSLTVMLQKEVGLRMLALPGDRRRGSLSSYTQMQAVVRKGFLVPPGAFFPPPKVDSIVLSMVLRERALFHPLSIASFEELNRPLFSAPRKSIKNA